MDTEQARTFLNKTGHAGVISILNDAPKDPECLYYVNEFSEHTHTQGFYADKFVVGVHNRHTHYKLSDLMQLVLYAASASAEEGCN